MSGTFFKRHARVIAASAVLLMAAVAIQGFRMVQPLAPAEERLRTVERDVAERFDAVTHRAPDELAPTLKDFALGGRDDLVVLDVREASEFSVSHLPGAARVDPAAAPGEILSQVGDLAGKTVIVYCSVGVRSSKLAARVKSELMNAGARDVVNLSGGIFRWHNEARPLASPRGETNAVHPYDGFWAGYLRRSDDISYTPVPR